MKEGLEKWKNQNQPTDQLLGEKKQLHEAEELDRQKVD
jgi:hypothetical protein